MYNIFKILEKLVGNIVENKNRAKNCLQSFFIYKLSANCNKTYNY